MPPPPPLPFLTPTRNAYLSPGVLVRQHHQHVRHERDRRAIVHQRGLGGDLRRQPGLRWHGQDRDGRGEDGHRGHRNRLPRIPRQRELRAYVEGDIKKQNIHGARRGNESFDV